MTWQAICGRPYRRLRLSRAERRLEVGRASHGFGDLLLGPGTCKRCMPRNYAYFEISFLELTGIIRVCPLEMAEGVDQYSPCECLGAR